MKTNRAILEDNPLWYKDAVIYEVHVRAFFDSNGDGVGDFRGLTLKLDYLQNLGVTAIWLLPFYPSPLKDDGYDISDYFNIHPAYGTLKDFKEFLKQAHDRGIRVITELVVNHTSDRHQWFLASRKAARGSKERDFYVWSDTPDRYKEARIIFKDFETSNWTWDQAGMAYYWHRFYSHQPDLNFENPEVHKALFKVIDFWMGLGVDGMRLDAVPYLYEKEGTGCENLPETHVFLKKLREHVDKKFKNRMLLAEANQWSEDAVKYFGSGDECHMAFNFPVMPRMFMAILLEDRFPLVDILEGSQNIPEKAQWALFLRNHDELTLEMVTDEERDSMYRFYARNPQAKINLGIRRRLAPLMWNNHRKIELLNMLLFSLPGTPVIYYGDEICMGDNFYLGDRNGVRTPMQWSSYRNAGFSEANPQQLYLPVVIDPEYHYESVNVDTQEKNLSSALWWMKRVLAMRKQYRSFGSGTMRMLAPHNAKVFAFVREFKDEKILVVMNLSRFSQVAEIDLTGYEGYVPVEVFSSNSFRPITAAPYAFTLAPYNYFWFSLQKTKAAVEVEDESIVPPLAVPDSGDLFESVKKRLETLVLPKYLKRCRWFRSKARDIRRVAYYDGFDLAKDGPLRKVALFEIDYSDGNPEKYFIPVFYESGDAAAKIKEAYPFSVMAHVKKESGEEGVLFDGTVSHELHTGLLDMVAKKKRFRSERGYLSAVQDRMFWPVIGENGMSMPSALLGAEQSNTTVAYDKAFIMKIYRKSEQGMSTDVEIQKMLAGRFKNTPGLAGYIEYDEEGKETSSFAKIEAYTANESDAWKYAFDHVLKYYERVMSKKDELAGMQAAAAAPADEKALAEKETLFKYLTGEFFISMICQLARRIGEMHAALASISGSPEFTPENFSLLYQRSVFQSMKNLLNNTFRLVEKKAGKLDDPVKAKIKEVLGLKDKIAAAMAKITLKKYDIMKIRIHGDMHLGQVLFTGNDFHIIDFEGEPARPVSERKLKRSPLRDVAGMLRSFHYAAHAAMQKHPAVRPEDMLFLEPWAEEWCRFVSGKFKEAYFESVKGLNFVPAGEADLRTLLDAFVLDKAVYEIGYEINNRPEWISIPLSGIKDIIGGNK